MPTILVIHAHPEPDSFGSALAHAYEQGAREAGAAVDTLRLADLTFAPVLRTRDQGGQPLEADLQAARRAIEAAEHLVIEFPVWWASMPALLKGFIDRTFLPGWAYRYEDGSAVPKGLLAGRSARVIATMDSPRWWYRWKHGRAAHRALVQATLHFVGIERVAETTIYRVRDLDETKRAAWIERVRALGARDATRRTA